MDTKKHIVDEAVWTVELNIECPACNNYFDYLETDEYKEGGFEVLDHARSDNKANIEVRCPECEALLLVKETIW